MTAPICLLCHARGAQHRPGRLGRYAQTCDQCEDRRGHLARAGIARPAHDPANAARTLQWSARPR
jgi:hypothetical protein